MRARGFWKGFVAVSLVGTAFYAGFGGSKGGSLEATPYQLLERLTRPASAHADGEKDLNPGDTYAQVLATIKQDFATPPTSPKKPKEAKNWSWTGTLTEAGIAGMLATIGDRYTEYWNPAEYDENMKETRGSFGGVGASLDMTKDKKVIVVEPIPNTPAWRAGILAGDIITHVDGKSVHGLKLTDEVIPLIRGEEGTTVTLTIQRPGKPKPMQFRLRREVIHSPIVEARMQDPLNKIGYLRLNLFNEECDQQIGEQLTKLKRAGMKSLIFDLRGNPGGLLDKAEEVASRFVPPGPVVWIKEKNGQMKPSLTRDHDYRRDGGQYPMVLLVNGGSASASEIVAGAIQDAKAGTLVGTRTFGKGLVQTIIPLTDGAGRQAAVKVTTQRYFTRNKRDINLKRDDTEAPISNSGGIVPDVVVEQTASDIEKMQKYLADKPLDRAGATKFDPQIQKAIEILKAKK